MKMPSIKLYYLIALLIGRSFSQNGIESFSPAWTSTSLSADPLVASEVPSGDTVSRITKIYLYPSLTYGFNAIQVYYGSSDTAASYSPSPPQTPSVCYNDTTPTVITVGATQRIFKITTCAVTYLGVKTIFFAQFYLSTDGITYSYQLASGGSPPSADFTCHTYTTPVGQEIVGFQMQDSASPTCQVAKFEILTRPTALVDCTDKLITLDIATNITGKSQIIFADISQQLHYSASDNKLGACGQVVTQLTKTPANATPMILQAYTSTSIAFFKSTNALDANVYSLTMTMQYPDGTGIQSASATYAYIDPCLGSPLSQPLVISDMTTSVLLATAQLKTVVAQEKITPSSLSNTNYCRPQYSITSVVASATSPLSAAELKIGILTGIIQVQTSDTQMIGTHTATVVANFVYYPSMAPVQQTQTFTITILPCEITSLQVVQASDSGILLAQSYTLSPTVTLSYPLLAKQTPNCGYASSAWVVTATGPVPANFQIIGAADGIYRVSPTTSGTQAGTYLIQVTQVTVNGITYGTLPYLLVSPSQFNLTVTTGCSSSVVTASTAPINIFLKVFDPIALYPLTGQAFADFTDTVSTQAGDPTLCPFNYSATISPSTISTFLFDETTRQFQIYSGLVTQIGTYTVTLVGGLTEVPTIFATRYFNIFVEDPCTTTTIQFSPLTLTDMTSSVLVESGAVTQQVIVQDQVSISQGNVAGTLYCGARTYTITSVAQSATFALSSIELTIGATTGLISVSTANAATVGTHLVTVRGKLAAYPASEPTPLTFIVTIDPCIVTSLKVVQASDNGDLAAQTYTLRITQTLSYALATVQTPNCGYTPTSWSVLATGPQPSNFQNINSVGTYQISQTTSANQVGSYTIQMTSVIVNGTSLALLSPSSFTLTVTDPCASTIISSSSVSTITMNVFDQEIHLVIPEFQDSVSTSNSDPTMCGKTYTATYVSQTASAQSLTLFMFDPYTRIITISSQSIDQIGIFSVTLRGETVDYPLIFATTTFNIQVNDPCPSTNLVMPTTLPAQMLTSVLVEVSPGGGTPKYETQQVGIFMDELSINHGDTTGTQFCGQRVYSVSSVVQLATSSLSASELTIDPAIGMISLYTANKATIGTHVVTVTVYLQTYPTKVFTLPTFIVEILPCVITTFSMVQLSPLNDQTYTVPDPPLSWSLVASSLTTQHPSCGYQVSLSSSFTPASVVVTQILDTVNFSLNTRNLAESAVYVVQVLATLNNYFYSPPAPTNTQTFQLTIVNPCLQTQIAIVPLSIENLITFAGFNFKSSVQYTFNDTESASLTLTTDSEDFCGDKLLAFKLNNTETTFINGLNKDYFWLSPPADTVSFGVAQGQVVATLNYYSQIASLPLQFTVTILGSVTPQIDAAVYYISQKPLIITYETFQVLPKNYEIGPNTVQAYVLKEGTTLVSTFVDFSCDCLISISQFDWITLDSAINQLTVVTSDHTLIGEQHIIVLVQSFEQILDVHPYSQFQISLKVLQVFIPKSFPTFYPPLPQQIIEKQCPGQFPLWSLILPQTLDLNESPVEVNVQLDKDYFYYNGTTKTIHRVKTSYATVNQTIKFFLKNLLNLTSDYTLLVSFVCEAPVNFTYYTQLKRIITQPQTKETSPARIVSISRDGLVDVHFYKSVFVPNFTFTSNSSEMGPERRQLQQEQVNQTLQQYISNEVIQLQVMQKDSLWNVSWTCTSFENTSLQLQLNFTDPMRISQEHQDQLVLHFIQPEQFLAEQGSEYMFLNNSIKQLYYNIPRQLPTKETAAIFQSLSTAVEQIGITVIIFTLVLQVIAKKVITSMWLYYCTLQLILLLVQRSNMFAPSSVELVINSISGIINLSSLDKKKIAEKLHLDQLTDSAIFQSLDGVALSAIGILLFVIIFVVAVCITKRSPKVQQLFLKVRDTIFWNFLIRYFQASFIGFNYSALVNVQKQKDSYSDIATSAGILLLQYGVVCIIACILLTRDLGQLGTPAIRQRIGNLYLNLETRERRRVFYGLIFYLQRLLIVLLLAFRYTFGIQWQLCQLVILMNMVYLCAAAPYSDYIASRLDFVNCSFLLCCCTLTATYSAWNTETKTRFIYGVVFDCFVGIQFVVNLVFVVYFVFVKLILKLHQARFRCKFNRQKAAKRAKNKQKAKNVAQIIDLIVSWDPIGYVPDNFAQQKQENLFLDKQSTQLQQPGITQLSKSEQNKFERHKRAQEAKIRQDQLKNQIELEEISEMSIESDLEMNQPRKSRPSTPRFQNIVNDTKKNLQNTAVSQVKKSTDNKLNQSDSVKPRQSKVEHEPIKVETIGIKSNQGVANSNSVRKIQNFAMCQLEELSSQCQDTSYNQKLDQSHYNTRQEYLEDLELKISLESQKVDYDLAVTQRELNSAQRSLSSKSVTQTKFEDEVKEYFSELNYGVRRYPKYHVFTQEDDMWPYFKQVTDRSYSGPYISNAEHREQVIEHLKKKWLLVYPDMPCLPLFVQVESYKDICSEIAQEVQDDYQYRKKQSKRKAQ